MLHDHCLINNNSTCLLQFLANSQIRLQTAVPSGQSYNAPTTQRTHASDTEEYTRFSSGTIWRYEYSARLQGGCQYCYSSRCQGLTGL